MKKLVFIFFLLLCFQIRSYSQFNYTFKKIIQINGFEMNVEGIKQTSDLGYVICGSYQILATPVPIDGGFLLKLNKNGSIAWYKKFESESTWGFTDLGIDNAGNIYLLAAGKSLADTTYNDLIIVKTNSYGGIVWTKSFGFINRAEEPISIDVTNDALYVSGYSQDHGVGNTMAYILKINTAGSILWNKTIDVNGFIENLFIKKIYNDRIIVLGADGSGNAYISVFANDGSLLNARKISYSSHEFYLYSCTSYMNNGYLIGGSMGSTSSTSSVLNPFLLAIDSSYNLQWSKKYIESGTNVSEFININKTSDGNYIATYEPENINAKNHLFGLVKLDSNGDQIWGQLYSQRSELFPYKLIETKDSGFAVAGYIRGDQYYNKNPYILKTDKNGLTDSCENDSLITLTNQNITPSFSSFGTSDSLVISANTPFNLSTSFRNDSLFCVDSVVDLSYTEPIIIKENIYINIPNVFTPNSDGNNDLFKISIMGYENFNLKIYDRWGELVFHTDNFYDFWDGKKSNKDCSDGTYYYLISVFNPLTKQPEIYRGFISLIR